MNDRRSFLKNVGLAAATATIPGASYSQPARQTGRPEARRGQPTLRFDKGLPIVPTASGPVRGYLRNGVHIFKGIPYGASTAGANRFMPPQPATPWTEPLEAVAYGYASLQHHGDDWSRPLSHFVMNFDAGSMSEACLNLNVWTPEPGAAKRPVLVWIHGGGFTNGSSFEMLPYDGENVVRRGDVVFVSINHRLNALGFLDLSRAGGAPFAQSANVGMLDIVAALRWVRDNVAAFGGDPANVTICGHSGGGGKVNALMRMPSAKGLFRRAIIQSGSFRSYRKPEDSSAVGVRLAAKLGLSATDLRKLQDMPFDQLLTSANDTIAELEKEQHRTPGFFSGLGWGPTADGEVIIANNRPEIDPSIPLLVGYTRFELASFAYAPFDFPSFDAAAAKLAETFPGKKGAALFAKARQLYPQETPNFAYSVAASFLLADPSIAQLEDRAKSPGAAPVYGYRFDWIPDICDGRLGAFHGLEIGFTFDNTERWDSATGGGERAQALASMMSEAWISFTRTGDPNHREMPHWPRYDAKTQAMMVFDDASGIQHFPDEAFHRILAG